VVCGLVTRIQSYVNKIKMKPRVGILSFSVIADDPRVRKQGDLLADAGWEVVGVGLPGHRSHLPTWRYLTTDDRAATAAHNNKTRDQEETPSFNALSKAIATMLGMARAAAVRLLQRRMLKRAIGALRLVRFAITPGYSERLYWTMNDKFRSLYDLARGENVDLWLANDWTTLPIARRLAVEHHVPFAYDTHELAVDEYAERLTWRLTRRPVIAAIEGAAMREAAFVSCVSEGIAGRLAQFYRLAERPLVLRNAPPYQSTDFRPTGERIRVLYHGVISPGRGLEACIESVPLWHSEFTLTIRGPGDPEYLAALARLVHLHGVSDRVTFAPSVPMVDLVRKAADHDIGLFALPPHSLQNIYVLPNKFFEYMMAGLALCVSDLPEMTKILKERDLGALIGAVTPAAIAAAVNSFDRTSIDAYKRNALAAALELSWETEGRRLVEVCRWAVS
jgi:glycosyltransferase involved in cell wall biosynthesis